MKNLFSLAHKYAFLLLNPKVVNCHLHRKLVDLSPGEKIQNVELENRKRNLKFLKASSNILSE